MWNAERGFGFIGDDSGGPDIFLHVSALQSAGIDPDDIRKGERPAKIRFEATLNQAHCVVGNINPDPFSSKLCCGMNGGSATAKRVKHYITFIG